MESKILILIACLSLAACSPTMRTGSLCTAGPILPDEGAGARWTRGEKEQVIAINESGEQICGWKIPGR